MSVGVANGRLHIGDSNIVAVRGSTKDCGGLRADSPGTIAFDALVVAAPRWAARRFGSSAKIVVEVMLDGSSASRRRCGDEDGTRLHACSLANNAV